MLYYWFILSAGCSLTAWQTAMLLTESRERRTRDTCRPRREASGWDEVGQRGVGVYFHTPADFHHTLGAYQQITHWQIHTGVRRLFSLSLEQKKREILPLLKQQQCYKEKGTDLLLVFSLKIVSIIMYYTSSLDCRVLYRGVIRTQIEGGWNPPCWQKCQKASPL